MKVILSLGHGRLHLVQSAYWLDRAGVRIRMVCGWVPRKPDGMLVRIASKIIGRDLSPGFKKRLLPDSGVEVRCCAFAEFFDQGLRLVGRLLGLDRDRISVIGWNAFGWQSRRHIKDADIFHVRSGAGCAGAIRKAHGKGMKVIVDQSAAHPAFMGKMLKSEYERNHVRLDLTEDSSFWQMVLRDCAEADILLVNSFLVRDTFVGQGYDPGKIRVVYLGVRPDFRGLRKPRFSEGKPKGGKFKLLYTGAFNFHKGVEYLLESVKLLRGLAGDVFEMDVVGDFSGARGLMARYERDRLPVTFHGPVPQDDLKAFLKAADVYVFPSLTEGCASSGMEAMAAGLCTVATRESGLPIGDGESGFFVPAKDPAAIADRLLRLFRDPREIDRVGGNAAGLIASRYTWEQYADNVSRIYSELAGPGGRARRK